MLSELYNICTDSEAKAADRIAAAKLFLDNTRTDESDDDTIKVIFENACEEHLR